MLSYARLVLATFFLEIAMNLPLGAIPLELAKEGVSSSAIAVVVGSAMLTTLLFSLPTGALSDRLGRLLTMRLSAGVMALVLVGLASTHGILWGIVFLGMRSIALVTWYAAKFAYAGKLFAEQHSISTIVSLGMLGNVIFALGPALGVFLELHGMGRGQYAYALISVALGFLIVTTLPKKYDVCSKPTVGKLVMVRSSWIPAMLFLIGAKMDVGVNLSLAVLTFHNRGVANGALLFTAAAVTSLCLRFPGGMLVERFGPRRVVVPIALLEAAACFSAAGAHTTEGVLWAGVLFGIAGTAVLPVSLGLLFEKSEQESRGAALGAYNFATACGSALGAFLAACSVWIGVGYPLAIAMCSVTLFLVLPPVLGYGSTLFRGARERDMFAEV